MRFIINYKKYLCIFTLFILLLLLIFFNLSLNLLNKEDNDFTKKLSEENITYHYHKKTKIIALSGLYYEYDTPSFTYKNPDLKIELATLKLKIGGKWTEWLQSIFLKRLSLHISTPLLARCSFIENNKKDILYVSVPNLTIFLNKKNNFDIYTEFLSIKNDFYKINLNNIHYHLNIYNEYGTYLSYSTNAHIEKAFLNYVFNNQQPISLTITHINLLFSFLKPYKQEISKENYKILLHQFSFQRALNSSPSFNFSGIITLPEKTGHLTVTFSHWSTALIEFLQKDHHALFSPTMEHLIAERLITLTKQTKEKPLTFSIDFNPEILEKLSAKRALLLP